MKILVTGGDGQLGQSLHKIGGRFPHHGFVFTDLPALDIASREGVDEIMNRVRPDVIVNCAAYTAVDKAESDPAAAERVNVLGAATLARAAAEAGAHLVHISTDYVFDGASSRPYTESSPTGPLGVYGHTKLDGERAVTESGCRATVIRTSWLYSEFGANFVKTMLRLGGERDSIDVVCDQVGSPTWATDLAGAVMHLIEAQGDGRFGTFNYANEGVASWYDLARAVFAEARVDVRVAPVATESWPTAAVRPRYSVLSKEKIRAAGLAVPWWRDSLARCIEAIRSDKN